MGGVGPAAFWTYPDRTVRRRVAHDKALIGGPGPVVVPSLAAGGPAPVAVGPDEGGATAAVRQSPCPSPG